MQAPKRKRKQPSLDLSDLHASVSACADVAHGLARRAQSMHRSLLASYDTTGSWLAGVCGSAGDIGREVRGWAARDGKRLETREEEWRTAHEQLEAFAIMLEAWAAEDSPQLLVPTLKETIVSLIPVPGVRRVDWVEEEVAFLACGDVSLPAVDTLSLHLCTGVDSSRCTVSGPGKDEYLLGPHASAHNIVRLSIADESGERVYGVEAGDVYASLREGAITSVSVLDGVVEVGYSVHHARLDPITLIVDVYGIPLAVVIQAPALLGDSEILNNVPLHQRAHFLQALTDTWLPGKAYRLLYRASRDGNTPDDFHRTCDNQGPTLTLINTLPNTGPQYDAYGSIVVGLQVSGVEDPMPVFGGYASVTWVPVSAGQLKYLGDPHAFLFSVVGPFTSEPVRFPVLKRKEDLGAALFCHPGCGPYFNGGVCVKNRDGKGAGPLDVGSCYAGMHYSDTLGQGQWSLTGTATFEPRDVEVFAVE